MTYTYKKYSAGFGTIEILIASTILTTTLVGVILVSFTNQSLIEDSQKIRDIEQITNQLILETKKIGESEFKNIQPSTSTVSTLYGQYKTSIDIDSPNFFQKNITVHVSEISGFKNQYETQNILITDYTNPNESDTCNSVPTGNWNLPEIKNSVTDIGTLVGDPTHQYSVSDVDSDHDILYASISDTDASTKETFFIFDIHDPASPHMLGKIDNAPTTSIGISALALASSTIRKFAYSANSAHTTSLATCTPGPNCAQLQVFDVTNPSLPTIAFNVKIPSDSAPFTLGTGTQGTGKSIEYSRGYVYLGLTKTLQGPEFNIFDAHDQTHIPQWIGGYSVGYTVHAIAVKNKYAYIVHETDSSAPYQEQLTILDISDPTHPYRVGGFFAPAGIFNVGKSLYIVGNTLYLGRLASRISGAPDIIPEFIALDISTPHTPPYRVLATTSLAVPESLNRLLVRGSLAYFVTSGTFQIWNIAHTPNLSVKIPIPHGGIATPSIDCERNHVYIGSNDASNRGNITIISTP